MGGLGDAIHLFLFNLNWMVCKRLDEGMQGVGSSFRFESEKEKLVRGSLSFFFVVGRLGIWGRE